MVDLDFLRQHIDFTCVHPHVSQEEMNMFCQRAINNQVATIYVPPVYVEFALSLVKSCGIEIGTTAGFPFGNQPSEIKFRGIAFAVESGAKWVDVCLDISAVRSGMFDVVGEEIHSLGYMARREGIGLKLIVESPYLKLDELICVTKLVEYEGIEFLKTATGVGNRVSQKEVLTIKKHLQRTKLKVAGGVTTLDSAVRFFDLGADIIGSSRGFEILEKASRVADGEIMTPSIDPTSSPFPILWLTGQTGAGKTTLAHALLEHIGGVVLDGNEMRKSISVDLGLTKCDRIENNLRIAQLAKSLSAFTPVIVAVIAPYEGTRRDVDEIASPVWIYIDRNLPVTNNKPYEVPSTYLVKVDSDRQTTGEQVERIMHALKEKEVL